MIRYAITDPSFFTTTADKIKYLNSVNADYVLFRDKISSNYKEQAIDFLNLSSRLGFKKIIHTDYNLADTINADGVHLTFDDIENIPIAKKLALFVVVSTHSIKQIELAKSLGADAVTFSPIFDTPNKGIAKGITELEKAIECCDIKIIALGGIVTKEHIDSVSKTNAYGFASIRYFANSTSDKNLI